jgi:hypothetical protein
VLDSVTAVGGGRGRGVESHGRIVSRALQRWPHQKHQERAEGGRAQRWRATAAACPSRAVFVLGECGAKGPPVATGCFGRPISTWRLDALAVVERARAGFETGGEGTWSLLGRC